MGSDSAGTEMYRFHLSFIDFNKWEIVVRWQHPYVSKGMLLALSEDKPF